MKSIIVHKRFVKQIRKLPVPIQKAFQVRRDVFLENENNPLLHTHALQGTYLGYKSFNVTADIRVVYTKIDDATFLFTAIGTHSELYS